MESSDTATFSLYCCFRSYWRISECNWFYFTLEGPRIKIFWGYPFILYLVRTKDVIHKVTMEISLKWFWLGVICLLLWGPVLFSFPIVVFTCQLEHWRARSFIWMHLIFPFRSVEIKFPDFCFDCVFHLRL